MKNTCCKYRFLIPVFILGFLALFSLAVFALWNHVLVDVLGVKEITYWQAMGILLLARILFGSFPCRRGGPGGFGPPWRHHKMMEQWQSMTPEEREKMMGQCGGPSDKP